LGDHSRKWNHDETNERDIPLWQPQSKVGRVRGYQQKTERHRGQRMSDEDRASTESGNDVIEPPRYPYKIRTHHPRQSGGGLF
jgi:hypothetical protein